MSDRLPIQPKKIAIFRALYLGDFICATPALTALRSRFPNAELTLIGLPWMGEILGRFRVVDRFESFPGFPGLPEVPFELSSVEAFLERMRREHFDLAVQLHGDGRISNEFVAAIGARESIGYCADSSDACKPSRSLRWQTEESEVHRWLRLVQLVGARASDRVQFPINEFDVMKASALLDGVPVRGPRIGLHCGSKLPSRQWPIDRFARLGNALAQTMDASIVLTGTESERPLTKRLRMQLRGSVLDLTGQTDLGTLAAVIDRLDLLVTNDTGASHLAAARRTPSVVLFGPSDPVRWAPLDSARHRAIDGGLDGSRSETSIGTIQVDRVFAACLSQLEQSRQHHTPLRSVGSAADLVWSR